METARVTPRALLSGMVMALLTILFFIEPLSSPYVPRNQPYGPLVFTDVRTVKLNHPISQPDFHGIYRVTIHAEFSRNSPWCRMNSSMTVPCPHDLFDSEKKQLRDHMIMRKGIPSL